MGQLEAARMDAPLRPRRPHGKRLLLHRSFAYGLSLPGAALPRSLDLGTPPSPCSAWASCRSPPCCVSPPVCSPHLLPSSHQHFMVWTLGSMSHVPHSLARTRCCYVAGIPSIATICLHRAHRGASSLPVLAARSLTRSAPPATPTRPWRIDFAYPPLNTVIPLRHSGAAESPYCLAFVLRRAWFSAVVCSCQVPHPSRLCLMRWVGCKPPTAALLFLYRRDRGIHPLNKAN